MRTLPCMLLLLLLPLTVAACSDAEKTDSGGVSLVISDFDGLPIRVRVNEAVDPFETSGTVQVGQLTLESIVQNPALPQSQLQTIELSTYEVRYTRADAGTRVPTPLVQRLFSTIGPGSSIQLDNLPVMLSEQILNPPISDLLNVNGGVDTETSSPVILLNLHLRFFGKTLGGKEVVSNTQSFTVEFVP